MNSKNSRFESFQPVWFQFICVWTASVTYPMIIIAGFWIVASQFLSNIMHLSIGTIRNDPLFTFFVIIFSSLFYLILFKAAMDAAGRITAKKPMDETDE
ncbi:hypothetical protein MmiHf6_05790 [Methanimicrococcus hongohii]|uniref:Uncharacterized protein n=1 Tax=Methanimicrococcus hongohii TaxID=3028295 RepID=A0AA96UZ00_9EURY|nr:hypothetical protein [Methanimicrococcus sp. Hf6]WNY23274.1 hypothetical protein MmiHf6_05790 [Methanimicrococcus sp. Hf6]